jgi:hypothetical protein
VIELDFAGPGLAALAAMAERGECIERGLLTPELRATCEATLAGWRLEADRYQSVRARAVTAGRTIATTGADQSGYRAAVREFGTARAQLTAMRPQYQRVHNSAVSANSQLEHDRRERARHHREIQDGRRARVELGELLGSRLAEALEWDWPLPEWFTSVLGSGPPEQGEPGWRSAAAQVLAYRMTYGVRGPGPSACARRRQWFGDLQRALDELRVSPTS